MSQRWIRNVQPTFIPIFFQKRLKQTKNYLKAVNYLVSVSMVKMFHNLIHFYNYKRQRGISCVQTTLRPIVSQKRLKPTKNCLEAVNNFFSVSMVNMCHNPMHLTNHQSQRWRMSVQNAFIPIFSRKRLKPTNICVEAVNSFVSNSMVKMCHNPMHLTNQKSQRWSRVFRQNLNPFCPEEDKTNKKLLISSKQISQCFYGQNLSQSKAFN